MSRPTSGNHHLNAAVTLALFVMPMVYLSRRHRRLAREHERYLEEREAERGEREGGGGVRCCDCSLHIRNFVCLATIPSSAAHRTMLRRRRLSPAVDTTSSRPPASSADLPDLPHCHSHTRYRAKKQKRNKNENDARTARVKTSYRRSCGTARPNPSDLPYPTSSVACCRVVVSRT